MIVKQVVPNPTFGNIFFYYFTSYSILRMLDNTLRINFIMQFRDNKLSGSWKDVSYETGQ